MSTTTQTSADFFVHVDRSVPPAYPHWKKRLMHPEWELLGPTQYDLRNLWPFYHDAQRHGMIQSDEMYSYLKYSEILANCIGLADLMAIQAKGLPLYRKLYRGKVALGWKSVSQDSDDYSIRVPTLYELDGELLLGWVWVINNISLGPDSPPLRFK
jgi:hypothetical protein